MKRIPFFKKWQKLKNKEFTTIRLDRGSTWYRENEIYKVMHKKEHLFNARIMEVKHIIFASLTEEIAKADLDPPDNTLFHLRQLLRKMYMPTGRPDVDRRRYLIDEKGEYYWDLDNDGCFTKLLLIFLERKENDK